MSEIRVKMGWDRRRFIDHDSMVDAIICFICTNVVEDPVQTPCEHIFCNECITKWMEEGRVSCPVDECRLSLNELKPPHRLTMQLLNNLVVRCKHFSKGCRLLSKLEFMPQLIEHEEKGCPHSKPPDLVNAQRRIDALKRRNSELNDEVNLRAMAIEDKNGILDEKVDRIGHLKKEIELTKRTHQKVWKTFHEKIEQLSNMVNLNIIKDSTANVVLDDNAQALPPESENVARRNVDGNACKLSHICLSDHASGGTHQFAAPKCLRGTHTMIIDSARGFTCDICFSKKEKAPRWRCDECDDDFCFACYPI